MVAKAATRSGEFFCFHCGKSVQRDDARCRNCGVEFDRIVESFRCPRCSNLLPVGAVACPSCNLGFKVKTVEAPNNISADDKFLMKLIEWGKQETKSAPPEQPASRAVRVAKAPLPPPPPPDESPMTRTAVPTKSTATFVSRSVSDIKMKVQPTESSSPKSQVVRKQTPRGVSVKIATASARAEEYPEPKTIATESISNGAAVIQSEHRLDVRQLLAQLEEESRERDRLENEIRELRTMMQRQKAAPQEPVEPEPSLSSQALKKLLEDRDREITELKAKIEELARREEHLNRKIRAYSIKLKELEALKRGGEASSQRETISSSGQEIDGRVEAELFDEREEWMKDQSKIKAGLIEIRNQLISSKEAGRVTYYPSPPSGELLEKIEVLEEKLADANKEREELREQLRKLEESRKDVSTLLKVLDQLLGKLPPEIIDEFSKSENFRLYEKVLDDLNI